MAPLDTWNRKDLVTVLVTMEDVYPREEWNFVYGIADIMNGVGVWSFARLDPQFPAHLDQDVKYSIHHFIHFQFSSSPWCIVS